MRNTIKRDQMIIQDMISKYGKQDVIKYVNRINEDFGSMMAGLNAGAFKSINQQRENRSMLEPDIKMWLDMQGITNYELYFDYSINLKQDLDLSGQGLSELPYFIKFRSLDGSTCSKFDISDNNFTDDVIQQLPREIGNAYVNISGNKFKDLYTYISDIKGGKDCKIDIRNNPDLEIKYEYLRSNGFVVADESQYQKFTDKLMSKQ